VASYHAVGTVGQAILGLLTDACPRTEFPTAGFSLYQAKDFQNPMTEGISVYLHRITVSTSRRHMPDRVTNDGRRFRPSLPLDLYFLVTPWAQSAAMQHHLLGWAMRVLEDTPCLPSGLLNRFSTRPDTFAPEESVTLALEAVGMQDFLAIWEVSKHHMQISATYVARVVPIDSFIEIVDNPPAQTRLMAVGEKV
jgi:hypothetical protein